MMSFRFGVVCSLFLLFDSGCATTRLFDSWTDDQLFTFACPGSLEPKTVVGEIWTKVESREMSGQFPAVVKAVFPGQLFLEMTNLIGTPQATLSITSGLVDFKINEDEPRNAPLSAAQSRLRLEEFMGGVPVAFVPALFLGQVPCPESNGLGLTFRREGETLTVTQKNGTIFQYRFRSYIGKPWVEWMSYQGVVKFVLDRADPIDPDRASLRWVVSSKRGRIDVRWKDRKVHKSGQSIKSVSSI